MVQQHDEKASLPSALTLFYCYARKDKALRDEIDVHLAGLHRSGLVTGWHDAMIIPGQDWEQEIDTHLNAASIILLLVSPDFLHSDYCYGREMQRAIERHTRGEVHVIPILIRSTYWVNTPFSTLQMLPTDAKPITQWTDRDAAFTDIARGIHRVVIELIEQKRRQQEDEQKRLQAEALIKRGKTLQTQKRYAEALPLFHRASQLAPHSFDASAWGTLGRALEELRRYEEAIDAYDHALSLDPNMAWIWNNKGKSLNELKRYEDALPLFERAVQLAPRSSDAWGHLGRTLNELKRYQEVLAAYDHALSLDPNDALAWTNKGSVLYGLQRYQEVLAACDHALSLDPNDALVLRHLRRTKEADAADQRARQLKGS